MARFPGAKQSYRIDEKGETIRGNRPFFQLFPIQYTQPVMHHYAGPYSLYTTLDLEPSATLHEIRQAYKRKLISCHPDKGGCDEDFRKLQEAYAILSHPETKAAYDKTLPNVMTAPADGGRVWQHLASGVTALVHGQTSGIATVATYRSNKSHMCGDDPEIGSATNRIQALHQDKSSTSERELTAAYLHRAQLYLSKRMLYHARFDIEEILIISHDVHDDIRAEASKLLERLESSDDEDGRKEDDLF